METKQIQIREWQRGEDLDSLADGEVVRMCDFNPLVEDFIGLYQGKREERHVLLSRKNSKVLRWRLSGNGTLCTDGSDLDNYKFLFESDREERDYCQEIWQDDPEYSELNPQLEAKGM